MSAAKIKTLWLKDEYLQQSLSGRKTIEVRAGYSNIRRLQAGDVLLLNDRYRYTIRRIGSYASFADLLAHEDPARIAPDLSPGQLLPILRALYPSEKEALGVVALDVVAEEENMYLYPCPSCGFLVFDEPSGSYDICPVCGWEDDHVQLKFPGMRGGANGRSLCEYQKDALKKIPPGLPEYLGYPRDPNWRPLTEKDCRMDERQPSSGLEYFQAAGEDAASYYWEKQRS